MFRLIAAIFLLFSFSITVISKVQEKKEDALCGKWLFAGIEEFGVATEVPEEQKSDRINFSCDQKVLQIRNGLEKNGEWRKDKSGFVHLLFGDKLDIKYRIILMEKDKLIVEHQTPYLVRTKYIFKKEK